MEVCEVQPDVDRTAELYTTLGVPSVKAMLLLMAIEERFNVQVPDEQFVDATSLEKLTAMVENLQAAA